MDTDKIIQNLNRRFGEPLPEFYKRRIIFWYDEDREFEDKIEELELANAKILVLTGRNTFAVKNFLQWMIPQTIILYIVRCTMISMKITGCSI